MRAQRVPSWLLGLLVAAAALAWSWWRRHAPALRERAEERGVERAYPAPTPAVREAVVSRVEERRETRQQRRAVKAQRKGLGSRIGHFVEDRTGLLSALDKLKQHRAPAKSKWAYVFGSATLFSFILLVVTGIALALLYQPDSTTAYASLQLIGANPLWRALRGTHYFAASAMIVLMGIHMLRVYLYGSYKYPREVNWLAGVLLLFLVLVMAFTGQILRWDQNGLWSVIVGAEQGARVPYIGTAIARFLMGGDTINGATVSHIFALHTLWVPAVIFGLIGLHLYLALKNGVSEPPVPGKLVDPATEKAEYARVLRQEGVPFWPDAAWRDVAFSVLVILVVVGLAWWIGPPALVKPPDPTIVQADPKPDWYLIWYFSILALWPYGITNVMLIIAPAFAVLLLLGVPFFRNRGERHPFRRPWSIGVVASLFVMVITLTIVGYREPWLPHFDAPPLPQQVVASTAPGVVRGAALFHDMSCEGCHKISGYGGIRGPNLTDVGARLTRGELAWRIQNGAQSMPPYAGVLTTAQLNDLLDFLQSRDSSGGQLSAKP